MLMHDFNQDKKDVILLIHPMLSSAAQMKELLADKMGEEYRYLIPDLSGHGKGSKITYQSAEQETEEIHAYMSENQIHNVKLGFGASLGGVVLFHLLAYKDTAFDHLCFEGTSFYTGARFLESILQPVFLKKHRKAVKDPALSREKMASMFGKASAEEMAENFIEMNEESIRHIVHDCTAVKLPVLSEEMQKKCIFAYGDKDFDYKQADKKISKTYPAAELKVWKEYGHCEKLPEDSDAYAPLLKNLLR